MSDNIYPVKPKVESELSKAITDLIENHRAYTSYRLGVQVERESLCESLDEYIEMKISPVIDGSYQETLESFVAWHLSQ